MKNTIKTIVNTKAVANIIATKRDQVLVVGEEVKII